MRSRRTDHGFSLLETLVAFTILSLVLGAVYRSYIGSSAGAITAVERYEAVEFGRGLIDEALLESDPNKIPASGLYQDTWAWQLSVVPQPPLHITRYDRLISQYRLELTVDDTSGRRLAELDTIFLRPKP